MLIHPIFKNLDKYTKKSFVIFIAVSVLISLIYQLFFRYEYKIYKGHPTYVIKLDKLTGKSTYTQPIYTKNK